MSRKYEKIKIRVPRGKDESYGIENNGSNMCGLETFEELLIHLIYDMVPPKKHRNLPGSILPNVRYVVEYSGGKLTEDQQFILDGLFKIHNRSAKLRKSLEKIVN